MTAATISFLSLMYLTWNAGGEEEE